MTSLVVNEQFKKVIEGAERGRYSYFDFSLDAAKALALKDLHTIGWNDIVPFVQALYPDKLICSGLFDAFLMFDINKKNVRQDPPKIFFRDLGSESKFHKDPLIVRIRDAFVENGVTEFHPSWEKYSAFIKKQKEAVVDGQGK